MPRLSTLLDPQVWSYALRSGRGRLRPELARCPDCGRARGRAAGTKLLITQLVRCTGCELLYRIPQDPPGHGEAFYQTDYASGMATSCPTEEALAGLVARGFRRSEKDFGQRIEVLRALGVRTGARVLDYGASWGYGVWQFREAGWEATGFELSRPRSEYARTRLGVHVVSDASAIPTDLDLIFSAHVLEHVPRPSDVFELARRHLKPGGLFVAFTPNGSDACRAANARLYHHSWGRLHGLYLDERYYRRRLADTPTLLASASYGEVPDLEALRAWDHASPVTLDLSQRELLLVFVRPS